MGSSGVIHSARLLAAAPLVLADPELALFVLNVGDGDSIVIRFPVRGGVRAYGIVDCRDATKTIQLIHDLHAGVAVAPVIRFVCATHPHSDHISSLQAALAAFPVVGEFWDSGFRFTSLTYQKLIQAVEARSLADGLRFIRPTSGFEFFGGAVRVTVLSPSMALRNRYDTYGIDVNNASIVLRVSYPVVAPSTDYPAKPPASNAPAPTAARPRTAILGGDAQTDAWSRVVEEFPHLVIDNQNWARQIGARTGEQPLACDFFKVSHHASKRGINLELIERLGDRSGSGPSKGPPILVASCSSERPGGYGFPHTVTQELLREVRNPIADAPGGVHDPDDELGIHYTSQTIDVPGGAPAGSIAYVMRADRTTALYRLGDAEAVSVDLSVARLAS